jgi:hypothetical protein
MLNSKSLPDVVLQTAALFQFMTAIATKEAPRDVETREILCDILRMFLWSRLPVPI